jgi:hypothetical protein
MHLVAVFRTDHGAWHVDINPLAESRYGRKGLLLRYLRWMCLISVNEKIMVATAKAISPTFGGINLEGTSH